MNFLEGVACSTIARVYLFFERTGRSKSFDKFPYLGVLAARTESADDAEWRDSHEIAAERYRKLLVRLGDGIEGDHVLQTAINLALTAMQIPEFSAYLNYYTGNKATLLLACEMEGKFFPSHTYVQTKMESLSRIFYLDVRKSPLLHLELLADNRICAYLAGEDEMDPTLCGSAEWFLLPGELHPMYVRKELAAKGADFLRGERGILQIAGEGGRRFLAKKTAEMLEKDLLLMDVRTFGTISREEFWRLKVCLMREIWFKDGAACFYGITEETLKEMGADAEVFFKTAVLPFYEAQIPVILCTAEGVKFPAKKTEVFCITLPETTREERRMVWQGMAGQYGLSLDCEQAASRFLLTPSEIAGAAESWRHLEKEGRDEMQFSRICCEMRLKPGGNAGGIVTVPSAQLSDLVIPQNMKRTLGEICCGAAEGYRIYGEWNLKRQYPYGRAMSVLLTGPPGTGKTMTAHVIASELGILLYQVDLSRIMDKYIGETEKHLEEVFAFAEKANLVLFFDEADALFGKRGEVAEGRDRYANMEVSYILQRIERFEGIVVLATNFYGNIDKAFLRRMKYVIKYEEPNAALRRSIWEKCLSGELPHEALDLDYLANQFEFTGGMIKSAVFLACVTALYEKKQLDMVHILAAVKREYEKMERAVTAELWGEYGYLME